MIAATLFEYSEHTQKKFTKYSIASIFYYSRNKTRIDPLHCEIYEPRKLPLQPDVKDLLLRNKQRGTWENFLSYYSKDYILNSFPVNFASLFPDCWISWQEVKKWKMCDTISQRLSVLIACKNCKVVQYFCSFITMNYLTVPE